MTLNFTNEVVYPEPNTIISEVTEIEEKISAGLKRLMNKISSR